MRACLDERAHGNITTGNMLSFNAMTECALRDERVKKERAAALALEDDEAEEPRAAKTKGKSAKTAPGVDIDDLPETDDDDLAGIDDEFDDLEGDEPEQPKN